ncbi:MAG: purine-nucleoside phosphorylase [Sporolactobacillus sp.]
MSTHIEARIGQVAETVLLPGDPLRAKYIADTYLEKAEAYNHIRGMLGYTGYYRGKRISVQGSGMGMPSLAIYVNELIREYGAKCLIRVGTCGGLQAKLHVRDVVLALSATTDSAMNRLSFQGFDYAPTADFRLLCAAYQAAQTRGVTVHAGNILSTDVFYRDSMEPLKYLANCGVLAVEMETAALYTLAAKYGVRALTVLTVSDHVFSGEATSAAEREHTLDDMVHIALAAATA